MKKGDIVKCVKAEGTGFTTGKEYTVLSGSGDEDKSITSNFLPKARMESSQFNLRDDDGDVRFVNEDGVFTSWVLVK